MMYGIVNSLRCILETSIIYNHIVISVNYTSVSKKSERKEGKERKRKGRKGREKGRTTFVDKAKMKLINSHHYPLPVSHVGCQGTCQKKKKISQWPRTNQHMILFFPPEGGGGVFLVLLLLCHAKSNVYVSGQETIWGASPSSSVLVIRIYFTLYKTIFQALP